jgi:hypothetical protein
MYLAPTGSASSTIRATRSLIEDQTASTGHENAFKKLLGELVFDEINLETSSYGTEAARAGAVSGALPAVAVALLVGRPLLGVSPLVGGSVIGGAVAGGGITSWIGYRVGEVVGGPMGQVVEDKTHNQTLANAAAVVTGAAGGVVLPALVIAALF